MKPSKLDQNRDEIVRLRKQGVRWDFIAKKFGVSTVWMCNWAKSRGLRKIKPEL